MVLYDNATVYAVKTADSVLLGAIRGFFWASWEARERIRCDTTAALGVCRSLCVVRKEEDFGLVQNMKPLACPRP